MLQHFVREFEERTVVRRDAITHRRSAWCIAHEPLDLAALTDGRHEPVGRRGTAGAGADGLAHGTSRPELA